MAARWLHSDLHVTDGKDAYAGAVRAFVTFLAILSGFSGVVAAQSVTMPLWPKGIPEVIGGTGSAHPITGPEKDMTKPTDNLIAGRPVIRLGNVSQPTLTVFKPANKTNGAAVVVLPGGGYQILAYDLEGSEVCTWLNSIGVTCVLVKYRVPINGENGGRYPQKLEDLQDAQRAMRLTREHATEWGIDPKRVGVLGFSAGGHLGVVMSIHPDQETYKAIDAADALSARPDFAVIIYPGYLVTAPDLDKLSPGVEPDLHTPPTFLLQAEDDPVHEENALVYFQALKQAKVPAELHIYAEGGHGYGLRPTALPITHWPALVETWLHTVKMVPPSQ